MCKEAIAKHCVTAIFLLFFSVNLSAAEYEVEVEVSGVKKGTGDLSLEFVFFTKSSNLEKKEYISFRDQNRDGKFEEKFDFKVQGEIESFYVFGKLLSPDGAGKTIGLMPLKLVRYDIPNYDRNIIYKNRNFIKLENLRIFYTGDEELKLSSESCWQNNKEKHRGKAARESYPFIDYSGFATDRPIITLYAIRDLVEHRFINTCPTWNRLRGMLRDEMGSAWKDISRSKIKSVLDYLQSFNTLAESDQSWREVHKIYNETLVEILSKIGSTELPGGQKVKDIIFDRHSNLIATHVNGISWQLDDLINSYNREKYYEECLYLFSQIGNATSNSDKIQYFIISNKNMRRKYIEILQSSTDCASKLYRTEDISILKAQLESTESGKKYAQDFVSLFYFLNDITDNTIFPHRDSNKIVRAKLNEIYKYLRHFESII